MTRIEESLSTANGHCKKGKGDRTLMVAQG